MLVEFLLKGISIGLLFGMPIGAVGAMTVQRTLNHGIRAGLLTGLGSSVADCLYALVGAFGLTLISDFLLEHQTAINLIGGSLLLLMGIRFLCSKKQSAADTVQTQNGAKTFLSSFAIGITNPAAILTFLFAFSCFGIAGRAGISQGLQLVLGIFIGTYLWWGTLSIGVNILKKKVKNLDYRKLNQVFGIILALFGVTVFVKTIM